MIGGTALQEGDTIGSTAFAAGNTNIAFDNPGDLLTIDVDGNGAFDPAQDLSITLVGIGSVTYHAADSSFDLNP